jgi:hypothetical protein
MKTYQIGKSKFADTKIFRKNKIMSDDEISGIIKLKEDINLNTSELITPKQTKNKKNRKKYPE